MKKQWLSLAVAAVLTSNVYAANAQPVSTLPVPSAINAVQSLEALPALSAVDMQAAFQQDTKPMQMAALSPQEMKETEGAFWWFFIPLVVATAPAAISWLAGPGAAVTIPTMVNRIRNW